jgi:hypothetical protein
MQKPIVIRENYCQVDRKKIKAGSALQLEDYIIKRFVTKIELPMPAFPGTPNQMHPAIALTYAYSDNAKGIQVAFGENVSVCENLSAFGKYHFSTFGGNRLPFDEGMQLLDHWLTNLSVIHDYHVNTVQKLIDTPVERTQLMAVIGNLFQASVCRNNGFNVHAPLNQSQVASMVGSFGKKLMDKEKEFQMTGWDVVNAGTDVLKPHNSDMLQLLEDTAEYNNFIVRSLNLQLDEPKFGKIERN